jgi:hypothetical protein
VIILSKYVLKIDPGSFIVKEFFDGHICDEKKNSLVIMQNDCE